eukprot:TRINITY_DN5888_c0_g1_i1.p2 TRINITY_DN5888_c0_g1~~TRINITY_DN5888_c0_g1_i1.p2  ORF type:complete len:118 (+),score=14.57 TRINITY_DN5888_c0_g1_i1:207-560(+)
MVFLLFVVLCATVTSAEPSGDRCFHKRTDNKQRRAAIAIADDAQCRDRDCYVFDDDDELEFTPDGGFRGIVGENSVRDPFRFMVCDDDGDIVALHLCGTRACRDHGQVRDRRQQRRR